MQDTHFSIKLRELHNALIDILSVMNAPQRDLTLIEIAGIGLDRALFPLIVAIDRRGPIGVMQLADRVGRDYTTVSRQLAKLEQLGLITRIADPRDRRVRQAMITSAGRAMNAAIDAAREKLAAQEFASWPATDIDDLVRLMRRFADALMKDDGNGPPP